MTFWIACGGKFENCRRGHSHADAMRDQSTLFVVSWVSVSRVLTTDWVAHAMAKVNASIAESHACECSCKQHLLLSFMVLGVLNGTREILDGTFQRLETEYVGDGVRALICWAQDW